MDFFDIAPFIDVLSSAVFLEEADCNQDGIVDFFDINVFVGFLANGYLESATSSPFNSSPANSDSRLRGSD